MTTPATAHCLTHYASGMVERWCDRAKGHQGPCAGHAGPTVTQEADGRWSVQFIGASPHIYPTRVAALAAIRSAR